MGGKSLAGIYAYYDAVKEVRNQYESDFDEIFIACGTGTTLTGVCAGMAEWFPKAHVHGISVARIYEVEKSVLDENMGWLNTYLNSKYDFSNLVFHEEFLLGGYGKNSAEEMAIIHECISHTGMIIDPTYVGKAFHGMHSVLSTGKYVGKKILFWNTGGLINFLSNRNAL